MSKEGDKEEEKTDEGENELDGEELVDKGNKWKEDKKRGTEGKSR